MIGTEVKRRTRIVGEPSHFFKHRFGEIAAQSNLDPDTLSYLERLLLLPLPTIASLSENDDFYDLVEERVANYQGERFDPESSLDQEIEFSRYTNDFHFDHRLTFEDFSALPFIQGDEETLLGPDEKEAAHPTSVEVAGVLRHIISSRTDRPALVLGNRSYGAQFVVRPMEEILQEQGIKVMYPYIRSTDLDNRKVTHHGNRVFDYPTELDAEIWDYIAKNRPDIFFVDGTATNEILGLTRGPDSLKLVMNTFAALNRIAQGSKRYIGEFPEEITNLGATYGISLWTPDITDKVRFVSHNNLMDKPPISQCYDETVNRVVSEGDIRVELISSVPRQSPNSGAFYDDLYSWQFDKAKPFLTPNGYVIRAKTPDEETFVRRVNELIKPHLDRILSSE